MKNQTGNAVRREDFFRRDSVVNQAWDYLNSGRHILLAAPRRVGKTSLLYYLHDNPQKNYHFVYLITQSVNNENEFFRRMLNKLLKTDYIARTQKVLTFLKKLKPNISKIGPDGVEFGVSEDHDYFDMVSNVLKSTCNNNEKLVIMIDEFPETLENIIKDEDEKAARHFLQLNRELRQDFEITKNIQFIYTGSIGLENVVSRLNLMSGINDLSRLKVPPLVREEAIEFIALLLNDVNFTLSAEVTKDLLSRVEWLIPFYIQLYIEELCNLYRENKIKKFENRHLDIALKRILEQRHHFEHWHSRLRISFKKNEYNFVKDVLNVLSENEKINSNEIFDLSVKHQIEDSYNDLCKSLVYDGYINNNDNPHIYRFNSPILRMWWRYNVAN